jgi:hypothetical protein
MEVAYIFDKALGKTFTAWVVGFELVISTGFRA